MGKFPPETCGPFEACHTPAGKPLVVGGDGLKLCTVDTDSDAHMIAMALNRLRPMTPPRPLYSKTRKEPQC